MKDPYYQRRLQKSKEVRKIREKVRPLSAEIKSASTMLMITMGCLLLITTVSFLYLRGVQSAKGYYLEQLQQENEQLSSDHRELQSIVHEAQALTHLEASEAVEKMGDIETQPTNYVGDATDLAAR